MSQADFEWMMRVYCICALFYLFCFFFVLYFSFRQKKMKRNEKYEIINAVRIFKSIIFIREMNFKWNKGKKHTHEIKLNERAKQ